MADTPRAELLSIERTPAVELTRQRTCLPDSGALANLLQYVPDPVMILNGNAEVIYANGAALSAADRAELATLIGRRPGEVFGCIHAAQNGCRCGTTDFCRYCGNLAVVMESLRGECAVGECHATIERQGKIQALDLRVSAGPMELAGQTFIVFGATDISAEKRNHFLERLLVLDVMNAATVLQRFAGLLARGTVRPENKQHFIERIASLADQIVGHIDAQRQLDAAEEGKLQLDVKPVCSLALLRSIRSRFDRLDVRGGRDLRIAEDAIATEFKTDPTVISTVLVNMVRNALEAAALGEVVTIGCRAEGQRIRFEIHNPTCMPQSVRMQVFNRFFSTKGEGRGLGTFGMKCLTENYLKGTISFRSTEQEGTTFTACYPVEGPGD